MEAQELDLSTEDAFNVVSVLQGARSHAVQCGESLDLLRTLPDQSIDSIVTDPPAGIEFMASEWDDDKGGRDAWITWLAEILKEGLRVLKPGGHIFVWAIPRTSHWTGTAVENAGFEVRDVFYHLFGTGFPHGLDVSKGIDKKLGNKREIIGLGSGSGKGIRANGCPYLDRGEKCPGHGDAGVSQTGQTVHSPPTAPGSVLAEQWSGFNTAIKPGVEPWILGQKPLSLSQLTWSAAHKLQLLSAGLAALRSIAEDATDATLSIVSSWLRFLEDLSCLLSTCTTETASSLTTDVRTLNFFLSKITPEDMLALGTSQNTLTSHAVNVASQFRALEAKLGSILMLSARTDAIAPGPSDTERELPPDDEEESTEPSKEHWILAQKPRAHEVTNSKGKVSQKKLNVVDCVLEYGTGALNIDACRVPRGDIPINVLEGWSGFGQIERPEYEQVTNTQGGWPANLVLSHAAGCRLVGSTKVKGSNDPGVGSRPSGFAETGAALGDGKPCSPGKGGADGTETVAVYDCAPTCPVAILDAQSGVRMGGTGVQTPNQGYASKHSLFASGKETEGIAPSVGYGDKGGASMFFNTFEWELPSRLGFLYAAKAPRKEKDAGLEEFEPSCVGDGRQKPIDNPYQRGKTERKNTHSTIKNLKLMRHLCRLITPPGGIVLDMFMGSGSTGCAALLEGFRFIGFDQSEEYVRIARARIHHWENVSQ